MREARIPLPELALIAGTRAALGFGLGLLLSGRWHESQRRAIGWTLLAVGIGSTIPLAADVLSRLGSASQDAMPERARSGVLA